MLCSIRYVVDHEGPEHSGTNLGATGMPYDLERFLRAQARDYEGALRELRGGRKRSHWIWYVFPQMRGLGYSRMSEYYGIDGLDEARAYMADPTLRARLLEVSQALLDLPGSDPMAVMGHPDDLKLRSCMTLFCLAAPDEPAFQQVLDKYFDGRKDPGTLKLLKADNEEW